MKNCWNCEYLEGRDCCYFCGVNGALVTFPLFRGGKKCQCYEKRKRVKTEFPYPKKEDLER